MYLKYLPESLAAALRKAVSEKETAQKTYEDLKAGRYRLSFRFDGAGLRLLYEAYRPGEEVLGFIIDASKKLSPAYGNLNSLRNKDLALALFLYENEVAIDEESLLLRYGRYGNLLRDSGKLTPEQAKELSRHRAAFDDLIVELEDIIEAPEAASTILSLSFDISMNHGLAYLSPIVTGKAVHRFRNVEKFLDAVSKDRPLPDAKGETIRLGINRFQEEDRALIYYLLSSGFSQSRMGYDYGADKAELAALLLRCGGKTISFADESIKLSPVKPLGISIGEDGSIHSDYLPYRNDLVFLCEEGLATLSTESHEGSLFSFTSAKSRRLFLFLMEHPNFPFSALQEEVAGKLLPLLQKDVPVDERFQEKSKSIRSYIAYYVTLEEEPYCLRLETRFMAHGYEIPEEEYARNHPEQLDRFDEKLREFKLPRNGEYKEDSAIGEILELNWEELSDVCSLYVSDNIKNGAWKRQAAISIRTSSGLDWFKVDFSSSDLSMEEVNQILKAYRTKKKYVRIRGGFYKTDDADLARAAIAFSPSDELEQDQLPLYQALKLKGMERLGVALDEHLLNLFQSIASYREEEVDLDPRFLEVLRPYQLDGVKWLHALSRFGLGGILADDMGLGKTLEMIAFLSTQKKEKPTLIVCPKSLIYNWKYEFSKWDPSVEVHVVTGNKKERKTLLLLSKTRPQDVFVISYDSLRNDEKLVKELSFGNVLLDEAQYIANPAAQKSKAVKKIKSTNRFVLTGTPIQNSYMDLWSIMDFLLPKYLEGFNDFKWLYGSLSQSNEAEIDRLEREIAPFLLRRRKDEVLKDLPPKTEEIVLVGMEDDARKFYDAYFQNAQLSLAKAKEDKRGGAVAVLAELTRLRQICVDPSSFLSDYQELSPKLERTIEMCDEAVAGGHKVLIFSSFVTVLKHLQSELEKNGHPSYLIYGDTSAEERLSFADRFNSSDDIPIMLVSLKAGGTGLNLVGADIVIHLDPWWNIAAENQASDRAHRIGQTRPVTVWKLVCKDTIEEKIIELQNLKKKLSDIIRVADEEGSSLTQEDIAYLLS